MQVTIKTLQGIECNLKLSDSTTVAELKAMMEEILLVAQNTQRLVFRGKPLTDNCTLAAAGVGDGAKIHLLVKKNDNCDHSVASSSKPVPKMELYSQIEMLLRKHLNADQTSKVVAEFKKNTELMINSMNFEDIERFAVNNFSEF